MAEEENREANGSEKPADAVCRDFLRNVCRRGDRCKYVHPDSGEGEETVKEFIFCHDYQNKECTRPNCKFLHCTRQEEEFYRYTGNLPQHALESISLGRGVASEGNNKGEIPVCKDFLKGECRRLGRCKFRHLTLAEYNEELVYAGRGKREFDVQGQYDGFGVYEPDIKRRALDGHFPQVAPIMTPQPFYPDYRMLEEENILLRRKVEELKKQVADLTATNEFLLDQNAQLRLSKQTTTVSPITQALIASIPQPITQMSQQLPMNTDLSAAAATAQTSIPPQAQSIVPVTLGQALAPVSIAPVSLAQALPDQSIPQNIITMSGPTTTLVSYPIMTQSMRPAIPHSLGH